MQHTNHSILARLTSAQPNRCTAVSRFLPQHSHTIAPGLRFAKPSPPGKQHMCLAVCPQEKSRRTQSSVIICQFRDCCSSCLPINVAFVFEVAHRRPRLRTLEHAPTSHVFGATTRST